MSALLLPATATRDSTAFHSLDAAARTSSKLPPLSAARLARAPSTLTYDSAVRTSITEPAGNSTYPPLLHESACRAPAKTDSPSQVPNDVNGWLNLIAKYTV